MDFVVCPSIRQILRRLDRNVPLAEPTTMEEVIDRLVSGFRIVTMSPGKNRGGE